MTLRMDEPRAQLLQDTDGVRMQIAHAERFFSGEQLAAYVGQTFGGAEEFVEVDDGGRHRVRRVTQVGGEMPPKTEGWAEKILVMRRAVELGRRFASRAARREAGPTTSHIWQER